MKHEADSCQHLELIHEAFRGWGRAVPAAAPGLAAFLDELARWSARSPLTGLATPPDRVEHGVLDAVPLADAAPPGGSIVDVGSGNGLPGMVLALLRPDLRLTLVEPVARRCAFLRTAAALSSVDVAVIRSRVEVLDLTSFDAAVSRAVFKPGRWLALAGRLVRPGGSVFTFLGEDATHAAGALSAPGLVLVASVPYRLPWSGTRRTLIRHDRSALA